MSEREIDERVRDLYPEAGRAGEGQRERAREDLGAVISAQGPTASGRWGGLGRGLLTVAAAGLTAAGAIVVLVLAGGPEDQMPPSSATEVLRDAAASERELAPPLPGPGEYLYVKSENAYLSSYVTVPTGAPDEEGTRREPLAAGISYSYLEPEVREVWMGENSLLKTRFGEPTFFTEEDREAWVADGSPGANGGSSTDPLGRNEPLDLPSDPDELLRRLRAKAAYVADLGAPPGSAVEDLALETLVDIEIFRVIGESLREQSATPAQRAALLEVASRLEGIELVGEVTDSAGRPGIAVALADPRSGIRNTLVFDPETSALLAEEQVITAADSTYGYPIGTVIGHATYLESAIVDEPGERP